MEVKAYIAHQFLQVDTLRPCPKIGKWGGGDFLSITGDTPDEREDMYDVFVEDC